ncbi:MAG: SurA N-terminal domain-containing protein [Tannerella sp.]|jgi:peptidyl-prolyl cis-trans isomerase D|nr:SurA N-terminal domain-containing protein [Tannerella sp.]
MATLQKIRNRAGLLVGVVGVALLAFIVGDGLNSGSTFFRQSKDKVLSVNGEIVKTQDFSRQLEELSEIYSMQMNGSSLTDEQQAQMRNKAFESQVRTLLMNQEGEKVGFTVTSDEVFDMVQGENVSPAVQQMPMFHDENGRFDRNALLRFLQMVNRTSYPGNYTEQDVAQIRSAQKYWFFMEKNLIQQKKEEKFTTLLSKALVVNSLDAKADYDDNLTSVDFDYAVQYYSSIPDSAVAVTSSEIRSLYKKRRELYKQDASAELKYILVTVAPSSEDFEEVKSAIDKIKPEFVDFSDVHDLVNENSDVPFYDAYTSAAFLSPEAEIFVNEAEIGNVKGPVLVGNTYHLYKYLGRTVAPDSIRVNELALPRMAEDRLKTFSDSLIRVVKGGQPFAELAGSLTGGSFTGDMGWLTDEAALRRIDEKFRDAIFSAAVNDVFVLKTSRGTHLIQVSEKTSPVQKYKVADVVMEVEPSQTTTTGAYTALSQYILKNSKADSFESEAAAAGYVCQTNTIGQNDQTLTNIPSTRQVVRWAFENKKGAMSQIYELDGDRYLVAVLQSVYEKGYRPVEAVAESLKRELLNDRKAEKIIADLKAQNLTTLEQYAEATHSSVQPVSFVGFATPRIANIGMEPALNAAAPYAEANVVSAPVKGKAGVYVFKVKEKHTTPGTFSLEEQKRKLSMNSNYRYMYQAIQTLRDKSDVEDFRIRFY